MFMRLFGKKKQNGYENIRKEKSKEKSRKKHEVEIKYSKPKVIKYTDLRSTGSTDQPFIASLLLKEYKDKVRWALAEKITLFANDNLGIYNLLKLVRVSYFDNIDIYENRYDHLLDLYLSIQTLLNQLSPNLSMQTMKDNVRTFFAAREDLLRWDEHDYSNIVASHANRFCIDVAKALFPDESPLDVLLHNAKTANRTRPWYDVYEMTDSLPKSAGAFFRTLHNKIHLYEGVLEQAISNLKRGQTALKYIWLGTDNEDPETPDRLNQDDLDIISQRSNSFRELIEYTKRLEHFKNLNSSSIYEMLSDLRNGLIQGDMYHEGKDSLAGNDAHIATAKFAEWWNALDMTPNGEDVKKKVKNLGNIGGILKYILDPGERAKSDTNYCVNIQGTSLQAAIENQRIRNQLLELDNTLNIQLSDDDLDKLAQKISRELKESVALKTNQNFFDSLLKAGTLLPSILRTNADLISIHTGNISILNNNKNVTLNEIKNFIQQKNYGILLLFFQEFKSFKTSEMESLFYILLRDNQFKLAEKILSQHPTINLEYAVDASLNTPLNLVLSSTLASYSFIKLVCRLSKKHNQLNANGLTPLEICLQREDINLIEYFIKQYAKEYNAETLIKVCLKLDDFKRFDLVKEIFRQNPSICQAMDKVNQNGEDILHLAVSKPDLDLELIGLLTDDKENFQKSNSRGCILLSSIFEQKPELTKYLIEHRLDRFTDQEIGAALRAMAANNDALFDAILQKGNKFTEVTPDENGKYLLHDLIEKKADIEKLKKISSSFSDWKKASRCRPILTLAINQELTDYARYLLEHHIKDLSQDDLLDGLFKLITANKMDEAKLLVTNAMEAKRHHEKGLESLPLILAVSLTSPDMHRIKKLANHKTIRVLSSDRKNVIDIAISRKNYDVARYLLKKYHRRFDFNLTSFNESVLNLIKEEKYDLAKTFLKYYPKLQAEGKTAEGQTALHLLLQKNSIDMELVKAFSSPHNILIPNADGITPLELAASLGHEQVVQFFIKEYANRIPKDQAELFFVDLKTGKGSGLELPKDNKEQDNKKGKAHHSFFKPFKQKLAKLSCIHSSKKRGVGH